MATKQNNLVGYCFSEEDLWEVKPDDLDTENSDDCFDKDIINDCLEDDHLKKHFKEIQNIGEGAFGCVYSAKHRIDSKKYALKFVLINSERFDKREVEVLSSLDHRNIIRYFTSWIIELPKSKISPKLSSEEDDLSEITFEEENSSSCNNNATTEKESIKSSNGSGEEEIYDACLVIQAELCNTGMSLKTLIDENTIFTMENKRRRNIILDIVWGLQHIHDKGFMHRDLKPPNIFIDRDQRAKIGDFGFARNYIMSVTNVADGNSPTSNKEGICHSKDIGTSYYIAPEVTDTTCYDRRADLYSLGMIIFEMFHKMDSDMERSKTMERLQEQNFVDLKEISEKYRNVREIIESLLNHEPSMRMELERVESLMTTPLAHQQSEENTKIVAQPVTSPDKEYPGPTSSIKSVEQARISETLGDMQQEKQAPPFDFQDMKDSVKIHITKNIQPEKED